MGKNLFFSFYSHWTLLVYLRDLFVIPVKLLLLLLLLLLLYLIHEGDCYSVQTTFLTHCFQGCLDAGHCYLHDMLTQVYALKFLVRLFVLVYTVNRRYDIWEQP